MTVRQNTYAPDTVSHPGETLRELLNSRGWTQVELAKKLGMATSYLNDVVHGRRGVSVQLAIKLEATLKTFGAEHWLIMQMHHDLAQARALTKTPKAARKR